MPDTHPDKIEIPPIQEKDLLELVGPLYFKRGEDYWRQRKVLSVKYIAPEQRIKSYVVGSGRKRYTQDIRFSYHHGELLLESECSCPVAFDCKHVAAALLEFLHSRHASAPAAKPEVELNRWMQSLQSSLRSSSSGHKADETPVLYILQSQIPGRVYVQLLKSRPLKKGGWGKASLVSLGEFRYGFPPYWCGEDDARLCMLIASQIDTNLAHLKGATGAFILRQMLATGRCFWQNQDSTPLREGEPSILRPQWLEQNDQYRLQLDLPGVSDWKLIGTDPPFYLDTDRHISGRIDGGFNSDVLQQLLQIPPVPRNKAAHFGRFLLHQPDLAQLPPPVELNERRIDASLIPNLLLTQIREGDRVVPLAELGFQYGEYRLSGPCEREDGLTIIEDGDALITIRRDRDAETAASGRLLEQGFLPRHEFDHNTQNPYELVLSAPGPAALVERWLEFIEQQAPALEQDGWQVRTAPEFDLRVHDAEPIAELRDGAEQGWFEMTLHVDVGGKQLPLAPLLITYLQHYELDTRRDTVLVPAPEGWLRLPTRAIQPLIGVLLELVNRRDKTQATLKLPHSHATLLSGLDENSLQWKNAERIRALSRQLRTFDGIRKLAVPAGLRATLRPYQQEGLSWLGFLREYGFSGILADDMGLGKTLQTLAFILHEKNEGRLKEPALIVAPTSLIWNWQQETARFAPELRVLILHGLDRAPAFRRISEHDLVITTYPLIPRDIEYYRKQLFSIVVLDEAQQIKNPRGKAAQHLREIKSGTRLCLTGTPMENHLGELWALLDFALPGLLGNEMFFRRHFRTPIEKHADVDRRGELRRRIAPFMLRRDKTQVIDELPRKTEIPQLIELEPQQRTLYETIRITMEKKVRQLLKEKGLAKSHIEFLDALLKLRQVCCDPRLLKIQSAKKHITQSAKLAWLKDNLPEMIEEGRRILLFSQFTSMLDLIEPELKSLDIPYCLLTGQTRNRPEIIRRFQDGETPLFLISLKAGGTGLNLTAADVVIHYDPWWNPAVEQQATDRAHRIGQDKPVFVYKLIARNTVEEKIQKLQEKKRQLADALFDAKRQNVWQGDAEELLELLS